MSQFSPFKKIILCGATVFTCFLGLVILSFLHGEPIHDVNALLLQKSFYAKNIAHPGGSVLLEKKKYLGGPSLHGGNRCVYAVGETRSVYLSKEEIKKAYTDDTVRYWNKKLPLQIIFPDEFDGEYTMPYVNWQDDLKNLSVWSKTGTLYTVFASVERPIIIYDSRCDD